MAYIKPANTNFLKQTHQIQREGQEKGWKERPEQQNKKNEKCKTQQADRRLFGKGTDSGKRNTAVQSSQLTFFLVFLVVCGRAPKSAAELEQESAQKYPFPELVRREKEERKKCEAPERKREKGRRKDDTRKTCSHNRHREQRRENVTDRFFSLSFMSFNIPLPFFFGGSSPSTTTLHWTLSELLHLANQWYIEHVCYIIGLLY